MPFPFWQSRRHSCNIAAIKALHKKGALIPVLQKAGVLTDQEEEEPVPVIAPGGVHDLLKAVDEGGNSASDAHVKRVVPVE